MKVQHLAVRVEDKIQADQLRLKYQKKLTDREMYDLERSKSKSTGADLQQFYVEFKNYYNSQQISSNCNDITFLNLGTNPVVIGGVVTLVQNQSLQISGNINEIDTTEYQIQFSAYASPNNNLVVIRKIYR